MIYYTRPADASGYAAPLRCHGHFWPRWQLTHDCGHECHGSAGWPHFGHGGKDDLGVDARSLRSTWPEELGGGDEGRLEEED